jgi:glycosyltransferase involved in cell wall biosynthesis
MRIGIDARMFRSSTGGIGVYSQNLLRNLAKVDKKNKYFIFLGEEDLEEYDIKADNFKPIKVNIPHYWFREQLIFPRILEKYNLDLVHFLNFNHPILYPDKFVVSIHDLTMVKAPSGKNQLSIFKRPFYKWVLKDAVKSSQLINTISQQSREDIINYFGVDKDKVKVTHLSIDKKRYQPVKTEKVVNSLDKYGIRKPYLLFVSQLRPHKGIDYLLEAFKLLKKEYRQKELKLILVGKDFGKFPKLSQKIRRAEERGDVIAPGFVENEDMAALYSGASVFVFPSLYEGFGLPPLEAMSCGTPVAASNRSCIPEVLGKAPLYFDPKDSAQMASIINTLLINQKLADKLVGRGFKQVDKYSWQKTAQKTLEIYKKAIQIN